MKRIFVLAVLAGAFTCGLHAQAVSTTVCDVLKHPKSFDGKMVSIKGTVVAGFDEFIIKDTTGACGYQVDGIWLSYPAGTKGKAGPVAMLQIQPAHNFAGTYTAPTRAAVTLDKSKDFKQFDSLLSQAHNKGAGMCLGCARYEVTATLVGRLDTVDNAALQHDKAGKIIGFGGFGNMNIYPARLVLQSVSDITPKEEDYSKSDAASKGETQTFSGTANLYDPMAEAAKSIAGLAGSPMGDLAKKAVESFGKPGDKNTGVTLNNGTANEAKDETLGAKDSPDGILFNVTMNQNRLEGDAQLRAIVHMGEHIAEMRQPNPGNEELPAFVAEYNAWSITAGAAVVTGQKWLTAPGGSMLWNSTWPAADRNTLMDEAIKSFLANEAMLSR